ncbi:MAG: M20/M25/M40 family metallo-hydrolase [Phycisphaerae bacterium]|nr:M20/M25/M40 family metallo-hydrolase [Phycisphaerae bacterium]
MYDMLRAKTGGLKDEVIGFAQRLVRTPSLSYAEGDVATLVEREMNAIGFDRVVRDEFGNVVGILFGRQDTPTLLLNCHMDTMPPGEASAWAEPVHSGRIEDGKLYGLGAGDCKGGLAGLLYTAALLKRSLLPLRGNLVVAATVAEEDGGNVGVRGLIEKTLPDLELKPSYAILGEPTGLGLYYGHDGWLTLEISVEGANPFHVDDAAQAIFNDIDSSHRVEGRQRVRQAVSAQPPRFEDRTGTRRATIVLDRRMGADEDVSDVLSQVKRTASLATAASGTVAVDVAVRQVSQRLYTGQQTVVRRVTHSWSTDPFHPLMERARQSLAAAGCEVRPGKWQLGRLGMGTAGGVLVGEYGIPTIGYGPGDEDHVHTANEYVETAKIVEGVYGTTAMVHGLIGVPVCGWTCDEI